MQRMHVIALAGLLAFMVAQPALAVISTQDQVDAFDFFVTGVSSVAAQAGAPAVDPSILPALPQAYLDDRGNVWQETNGMPGLQTEHVVDQAGHELAPADSFVGGIDSLTGL
ncbi:MAG: hypothetical protein LC624_04495 [Halobacteriales archaeon]|nr:hypothetical protein [Halobacteriales archaeon]